MGVIIPSVPYKSQYDADASEFRNDCGPCCVAMVVNAFGHNATTNAVYRRTGTPDDQYVHVSNMIRAAESYDVPFDYFARWSFAQLKEAITNGHPVIPLVHYGAWSQINPGVSTQSTFQGPHFVVVVGFDDTHVYVNDPLWQGSRREEGHHKAWTHAEFLDAWGSNNLDGQRDYSGINCELSLPVEAYGDGAPPPPPPFELDPEIARRIYAWACYHEIPLPEIDSPAVLNAYLDSMGTWGERVTQHEVMPSDTLGLLALRYYDDPTKWQVITYYNGLTAADTIHNGDILLIPEPLEQPVEVPSNLVPQGNTPLIYELNFVGPPKADS